MESGVSHRFPMIPYEGVESEFIRDEIASGDYYDLNHRQYVNDLIYVEWYAKGGLSPNASGLSAAIAEFRNWRVATKYPEAFDGSENRSSTAACAVNAASSAISSTSSSTSGAST